MKSRGIHRPARRPARTWGAALAAGAILAVSGPGISAQTSHLPRVVPDLLEVSWPSERVQGEPGRMATRPLECRNVPASGLRRRIVDISAQEWAFFGFPIMDEASDSRLLPPGMGPDAGIAAFLDDDSSSRRRYWRSSDPGEAGRVASSIAGYWAVTAEGPGIVRRQNDAWNGEDGIGSRWVDPWSAAFISWVMCEAGLATPDRFRRSIAHRVYIDQAIVARDRGVEPGLDDASLGPAFVAYDLGEMPIEPGDMLCASSRPAYRNLAERRGQLGVGARTHCDIVVKVDPPAERILTIGGNVMRSVSMKIFPATMVGEGHLRPIVPNPRRPLFAHLKLRAAPIEPHALDTSPTVRALVCGEARARSPRLALVGATLGALSEPDARPSLPSFSAFEEPSSGAEDCETG